MAILFAGCTKEQDLSGYATVDQLNALQQQIDGMSATQVYTFSVNFPAVENEHYSQAQYNGLSGKLHNDDAILVYAQLFGAWAQLPYCLDNLAIAYWRDGSKLYFRYGRANYVEFTQDAETIQMKAIIIPQDVFAKIKDNGVDLGSYNDVIDACSKTDAGIVNQSPEKGF